MSNTKYVKTACLYISCDQKYAFVIKCLFCCSNFMHWATFMQHMRLHKNMFEQMPLKNFKQGKNGTLNSNLITQNNAVGKIINLPKNDKFGLDVTHDDIAHIMHGYQDNEIEEIREEVEAELANLQQISQENKNDIADNQAQTFPINFVKTSKTDKANADVLHLELVHQLLEEIEAEEKQQHKLAENAEVCKSKDILPQKEHDIEMTDLQQNIGGCNNIADIFKISRNDVKTKSALFKLSSTKPEIMLDFIDCLKQHECQWNNQHPDYVFREKRMDSAFEICKLMSERWQLRLSPGLIRTSILRLRRWFELEYVRFKMNKDYQIRHQVYYNKLLEFMPHSHLHVFICDECERKFRSETSLLQHKHATHNAPKPHICEYCGQGFSHISLLRQHENRHTKNVVWKCNQCDYESTTKSDYRVHLTKHSNVRSYECECGCAYKSSTSLAVHRRTHQPPTLKCAYCDKMFYENYRLKRHVREKHANGIGAFSCSSCHKLFESLKTLRAHKKKHEKLIN